VKYARRPSRIYPTSNRGTYARTVSSLACGLFGRVDARVNADDRHRNRGRLAVRRHRCDRGVVHNSRRLATAAVVLCRRAHRRTNADRDAARVGLCARRRVGQGARHTARGVA